MRVRSIHRVCCSDFIFGLNSAY